MTLYTFTSTGDAVLTATVVRAVFANDPLISTVVVTGYDSLENAAFYNETPYLNVTSITISEGLTLINSFAIQTLPSLTTITLPASLTTINSIGINTPSLTTVIIQVPNGLGLTPATGSNIFGATGVDIITPPPVPICFPAGTPVTTDEGEVAIEKLRPGEDRIRGREILAITQTRLLQKYLVCIEKDALAKNVPSRRTEISKEHKVYYKGEMVKANDLLERCEGVTRKAYNGETLYNVLLKKHDKMMVNNLICETLDPRNIMSKICGGNYNKKEQSKLCEELSELIVKNDVSGYKKLYASLK